MIYLSLDTFESILSYFIPAYSMFLIVLLFFFQVIANISVTVMVLDVNDNAPVFTKSEYFINASISISENQKLTTITVSIHCFIHRI